MIEKQATPAWLQWVNTNPVAAHAIGTALGGGIGALVDRKKRLRNALIGAMLGNAGVGGLRVVGALSDPVVPEEQRRLAESIAGSDLEKELQAYRKLVQYVDPGERPWNRDVVQAAKRLRNLANDNATRLGVPVEEYGNLQDIALKKYITDAYRTAGMSDSYQLTHDLISAGLLPENRFESDWDSYFRKYVGDQSGTVLQQFAAQAQAQEMALQDYLQKLDPLHQMAYLGAKRIHGRMQGPHAAGSPYWEDIPTAHQTIQAINAPAWSKDKIQSALTWAADKYTPWGTSGVAQVSDWTTGEDSARPNLNMLDLAMKWYAEGNRGQNPRWLKGVTAGRPTAADRIKTIQQYNDPLFVLGGGPFVAAPAYALDRVLGWTGLTGGGSE